MTCSRCSGACTCTSAPDPALQTELLPGANSDAWRKEVSDRLHRYQARRKPRGPRYPSLRLKFEASEGNWSAPSREPGKVAEALSPSPIPPNITSSAVAMDYATRSAHAEPPAQPAERAQPVHVRRQETAKVIEFPTPAYPIEDYSFALAEPMLDRPRILEAPEITPPPPALGGITIEPVAKLEPERRAGIDMPLQSAPATRRTMAAALDGLVVLAGSAVFAVVFHRVTHTIPAVWQSVAAGAGAFALFWFLYQYLFLVNCGTTPGMRALRLRMERFDGKPAGRRTRRARVLCHLLSLSALGMGYAWQFLDEDGLCWHERVTKTHVATDEATSA